MLVANARRDPVLIGAIGGSGTRVITRLVRRSGVFMGERVNHAEDSQPIMAFYATWLRRFLRGDGELPTAERDTADGEFHSCLEEHLAELDRPERAWGVKVPRNILMLRLWHRTFPDCRFVHVVRDGMDMAYSRDRNQLNMVGDLVLSPEEQRAPEHLRAIAYWQRVNLAAADFGKRNLGGRYIVIRFEDLCATPARVCRELFEFLGVPSDDRSVAAVIGDVEPPSTIGRWRTRPADDTYTLMTAARPALMQFGYWDDTTWQALSMARELR